MKTCIFIGESYMSELVLKGLDSYEVIGLIGKNKSGEDNCDITKLRNIPSKYTDKTDYEFIKDLNPDVVFCIGWRSIIPKELLVFNVIGYHPTPLPQLRGPHPAYYLISSKFNKTASTFFLIDEGLDSGDILSQVSVDIYETDTPKTLIERLAKAALSQIKLIDLNVRVKQDESKATYLKKRKRSEWIKFS